MAYRRFKRRKARVQWMPPVGSEPANPENTTLTDFPAQQWDCGAIIPGNQYYVAVQDLTWDYPPEAQAAIGDQIPSLADWDQSAWRLRRIVGKFFCGISTQGAAPASLICASFIVLKCHEEDGTPLRLPAEYNALTVGNNRDPWIWRRTWMVGGGLVGGNSQYNQGMASLPQHNVEYGSVQDGPHIDAKTNRIIGPDERLYLVVTAQNLCGGPEDNNEFYWVLDYRLLGSTMKASNRRNASR